MSLPASVSLGRAWVSSLVSTMVSSMVAASVVSLRISLLRLASAVDLSRISTDTDLIDWVYEEKVMLMLTDLVEPLKELLLRSSSSELLPRVITGMSLDSFLGGLCSSLGVDLGLLLG